MPSACHPPTIDCSPFRVLNAGPKKTGKVGVSLFSPLSLVNGVCLSKIILPQIRTRRATEHLHERHNRSPTGASHEASEHTLARDEVESPHTIN